MFLLTDIDQGKSELREHASIDVEIEDVEAQHDSTSILEPVTSDRYRAGLCFYDDEPAGRGRQQQDDEISGKSRARMITPDAKRVTFDDVAGLQEEKEELEEIVDFLKEPSKFIQVGARIPKGVILVGPPGTGEDLCWRRRLQ